MRAKPHLAAALTVLMATWLASQAAFVPAARAVSVIQATGTTDPDPTGTPVVNPVPPPVPLHLPLVLQRHDFKAPGPVLAAARGWLFSLTAERRNICFPLTHVLRETDDAGSSAVAFAYALRPNDPATALDLYMGSYVELSGIEGGSPQECELPARSLGVDRVRILDRPGGGPPATSTPRTPG